MQTILLIYQRRSRRCRSEAYGVPIVRRRDVSVSLYSVISIFLGDATNLAEIEEILALTKALKRICPDKAYTVRVNDRAILKGMADYSGFPENETDKVFIILDKMDKIGLDGVREELLAEGYAPEAVEKYTGLLVEIQNDAAGVRALGGSSPA